MPLNSRSPVAQGSAQEGGHWALPTSTKSDQLPKSSEFLRFSTAGTAPSRSTTEIARTRQMPLHKQGDDRDRIVFGSQNANALIHRKRRLYLTAAVQDAEYPDALVAARGIA
jgi:hypothetical protein